MLLNACNQQDVAYHMGFLNGTVGIFDEEILKNDISTVTTAFNSPNQFIFLKITVKEDLAQLIVESIVSREIELDRNYVAHIFGS
ncbi:8699_t:CDS:2, partial [Funneliformis geosporum]